MRKREFKPVEGVSNIELFYDLIFVYGISVLTSLCHHIEGGFLDWGTWAIYMFSFLVILQVWFFSTLLMNRYGDRSLSECVGLFVNMFLLYFLANGVHTEWHDTSFMFNLTWAGILLNLAIQWFIKLRTYSNIDDTDRGIMRASALPCGAGGDCGIRSFFAGNPARSDLVDRSSVWHDGVGPVGRVSQEARSL